MGSIKQNYANNVLTNGKFDATDLDGVIPNTNINDNSIDNITVFGTAGAGIPSVASDPPSPALGDVWFNSTSNALKYTGVTTAGAWATGGNLGTARRGLAGAGTQTEALAFGGRTTVDVGSTEEYDGSTWTANPTGLNTVRRFLAGAGTQTAALAFGGTSTVDTTATEEYNEQLGQQFLLV